MLKQHQEGTALTNIFEDHASLYHEYNLGVIPLIRAEKRPIYNDWSRYCKVKPELFELEKWGNKYKDANLGLPLGEANGVVGFDLDVEKVEAIAKKAKVPKSKLSNEDMMAAYLTDNEVTVIHTENIFIGHTMHKSGNR